MEEEIVNEQTEDTDASQSQAGQDSQSQSSQQPKTGKVKNPCIVCAKACTSGTIQCEVCSLWCHRTCTKLSKEALKGLEVQAREVGQAYWACRACMSFNNKWHAHMRETTRRQDETEKRVEDNRRGIDEVRNLAEATRKEVKKPGKSE